MLPTLDFTKELLSDAEIFYYRKLARQCGVYAAACKMRKQGFSVEAAKVALAKKGVRKCQIQ